MQLDLEHSLIFSLSETLMGYHVDSKALTKALELFCNAFSFECGFIYETDYSNWFCLKEYYSSCDIPLQERLPPKELSTQKREELLSKGGLYLERGDHNSSFDAEILDQHAAQSIYFAPIFGQSPFLCGFVVFIGLSEQACLDEEDQRLLRSLLSMLILSISGRMYQVKLAQSMVAFENLLDNTGIDIYVNELYTHDILYVNKSMAAPYGGKEAFDGRKCWEVLFPGQAGPCAFCPKDKLLDEQGEPKQVYSWDYQRAFDGLWFRVFSSAFHWGDGRLAHMVCSADITDNKRNEALIENLANFDQLTKLPNRRMLLKECERRIDQATAIEKGYVMFFDIDGFKAINDTLGHDAGDEFLIDLGQFFAEIPLLKDSIYRNGGDEFVAVVGGEAITKAHIQSLSNFIHQRFKKPWKLKKGDVFCSTSIGVACYPEDGTTADQLLQIADMAMYQVKRSGGGGLCFGYQLP